MRTLTKQQQDQWNWKFIFLGANMDAIEVGGRMGFAAGHSITYDDCSYDATTAVTRSARPSLSKSPTAR